MTAADILKECGFSSAEEVAALDGKFPGSGARPACPQNDDFDYTGCRVRLIKKGECDGTGSW